MFAAQQIPYRQTGSFSKIILDYLEKAPSLASFYEFPATISGIKEAISEKQRQEIDRSTLVKVLQAQYEKLEKADAVMNNINLLAKANTFTICTAHQPNLFTGPLYFIYKILHAIKLANDLQTKLPEFEFVPVFYMGSEDADLAELNNFSVEGKKYEWRTSQKGAVGRMRVDDNLLLLINDLESQLAIHPFGKEWISLLRSCYKKNETIQEATLHIVHQLFSRFGLVVLIADHPELKHTMKAVFEDDLFFHKPYSIVTHTGNKLQDSYKEQAHARDINLFYLKDDVRERIERKGDQFIVCNTDYSFSADEIKKELIEYPERFSPNVILRGLFQETILPNIAFIGGGGEVAYWLQLKELFQHYKVVFPALVLRNSFLIVEKKWDDLIRKLELDLPALFQSGNTLLNTIVAENTENNLSLQEKLEGLQAIYSTIEEQASSIDPTLVQHVRSIKVQAVKKLEELEKKMLRAEKRKFTDHQNQIAALKAKLFPGHGLQERVDNLAYYYAKWGTSFIDTLYEFSKGLEQEFTVVKE